ncbi:hypothetical protein G6F68_015511 [Rhizopus microsporus]|nr:hypothetical protein G6F68_015511 [Rhizopus microsporus]
MRPPCAMCCWIWLARPHASSATAACPPHCSWTRRVVWSTCAWANCPRRRWRSAWKPSRKRTAADAASLRRRASPGQRQPLHRPFKEMQALADVRRRRVQARHHDRAVGQCANGGNHGGRRLAGLGGQRGPRQQLARFHRDLPRLGLILPARRAPQPGGIHPVAAGVAFKNVHAHAPSADSTAALAHMP